MAQGTILSYIYETYVYNIPTACYKQLKRLYMGFTNGMLDCLDPHKSLNQKNRFTWLDRVHHYVGESNPTILELLMPSLAIYITQFSLTQT